jgi:hypothetical protein
VVVPAEDDGQHDLRGLAPQVQARTPEVGEAAATAERDLALRRPDLAAPQSLHDVENRPQDGERRRLPREVLLGAVDAGKPAG